MDDISIKTYKTHKVKENRCIEIRKSLRLSKIYFRLRASTCDETTFDLKTIPKPH
jgi:hypothetical protein